MITVANRRHRAISSLLLLIVFAFGSGRYLAPQRTVYLIGTPIEPLAAAEPDARANARASSSTHEARAASSTDEVVTICGAPTKSGKPCQRKVKGGGYCYQHRDRYGPARARPAPTAVRPHHPLRVERAPRPATIRGGQPVRSERRTRPMFFASVERATAACTLRAARRLAA